MENKKAQGFDTFKLLIAAVVAMVILGIVTGVFQKIWDMINGLSCVSSPVNELTTTIQSATTGMTVVSGAICFSGGESLEASQIASRLSNVNQVSFNCNDGAAVCTGDGAPVDVAGGGSLTALNDATLKAKVKCTEDSSSGNFACEITVINA